MALFTSSVSSGMIVTAELVSGGTQTVYNGGSTYLISVSSGVQVVSSGGSTSMTAVVTDGTQIVSNGGTANSTTIHNDGLMIVSSGGFASSATIKYGGEVNVLAGTVDYTKVEDGGSINIFSGGTAENTVIDSSGVMNISNGGMADYTIVSGVFAKLYVNSGGVANNTSVHSATMYISSGATASNVTIDDASGYVYSGGQVTAVTISNYGGFHVNGGGTASSIMIQSSADLYVSSGGVVNQTTINSRGEMYVSRNGIVNDTLIKFRGLMDLCGETQTDVVIQNEGGFFYGHTDDTVTNGSNCNGAFYISNGIASNVIGGLSVSSGHIAYNTTALVNMHVYEDGTVSNTIINSSGGVNVYGGTAIDTMINSGGSMYVATSGKIDNTIVNNGGTLEVYGTATSNTINSNGYFEVLGHADETIVNNGGEMCIYRGSVSNTTINSGGELFVSFGSATDNTLESGGKIVAGSESFVFGVVQANGGVFMGDTRATVLNGSNANGIFFINNGIASGIIGGVNVYSGHSAVNISATDTMKVSSGGSLIDATVESGGQVYVSGTAAGTTVNSGGYVSIAYTGQSVDTIINSGGYVEANYSGQTISTTINSAGLLCVSSRSIADSTTINDGGEMIVFSSGSADNTAIQSGGRLYVSSYASVSGVTQVDGGVFYGMTNATVLNGSNASGSFYISSGVASNIIGGLNVYYRHSALDTTLVTSMYVSSGGYADGVTQLDGGIFYGNTGATVLNGSNTKGLFHISSRVASNIIGGIDVAYNGSALDTTVVTSMYVSSGGYANGVTQIDGGIFHGNTRATVLNGSNTKGAFYISSGVASNIIGGVDVSSGHSALNTTVLESMYVASGGFAQNTMISSGGNMTISRGEAVSTTIGSGGRMSILNGSGTDINQVDGGIFYAYTSATVLNGSNANGSFYISNGVASNIIGGLVVSRGHSALDTTVLTSMYVNSSGYALNTVTDSGGILWVNSGGTASNNTINSGGSMFVSLGGRISGELNVNGGCVSTFYPSIYTNVMSGSDDTINLLGDADLSSATFELSGGGDVNIAGTNNTLYDMTISNGGMLNFDISGFSVPNTEYMLNSIDVVTSDAYAITIDSEQSNGQYLLADVAKYFNSTVSIYSDDTLVGSLTLDDVYHTDDQTYSLDLENYSLVLNVSSYIPDDIAPSVPDGLVDTVNLSDVALDWNDSTDDYSGIKGYIVEYSVNSDFTNAVSILVTPSELDLSGLADGTWYWRVKAVDNAGNESAWSYSESFYTASNPDIDPPSVPDGLVDSVTLSDVALDWNDSTDDASGVKEYVVEYSVDSDFTGAISQTVTTSELDLSGLADGTWYWRVKAVDNVGNESAWSDVDTYTIYTIDIVAPEVPDGLVSNVDAENAALDWNDANDDLSGVKEYVVEYSLNADFTGASSQITASSELDLSDLADGTWYWRVKTIDNADNESAWSAADSYTIYTIDIVAPEIPTDLTSEVVSDNVTLDWADATDDLSGVKEYLVEYSLNSDFSEALSQTVNSSETAIYELSNGTWYWRVKTVDNVGNESDWSSDQSFYIPVVDKTGPSTPVDLVQDVEGDSVALDWADSTDDLSGVNKYIVEYSSSVAFDNAETITVYSSNLVLAGLMDNIWHWRVKAVDNDSNEGNWSSISTFVISTADNTPPSIPGGLSDAVNYMSVHLDWTDSIDSQSDVTGYIVEYSTSSAFVNSQYQTVSNSELDLNYLAADTWYWRVTAVDSAGNESSWSNVESFVIANEDIAAPEAPDDLVSDVITGNVLLDWSDSTDDETGVKEYIFGYSTRENFAGASYQVVASSEITLTDLLDGVYFWRVRSADYNGNLSDWSSVGSFSVDLTAPDSPSQLSFIIDDDDVTFNWSDSFDNMSGVSGYIIEYGFRADFNDAIISSTSESACNLWDLVDGSYHWRVKAVDNSGNETAWVLGEDIVIDNSAPAIPTGVAIIENAGTTLLDWNDSSDNLTGVKEYVVEYATNALFSNATSYVTYGSEMLVNSLPDGSNFFRVKAVDNNGNESAWSEAVELLVDQSSPETPAGLKSVSNGCDIFLDWQNSTDSLSGVKEYLVQVSSDADFLDAASFVVSESYLDLTDQLYGTYYWRARAIDDEGNESAWTDVESFSTGDTAGNRFSQAREIVCDSSFVYEEYVGKRDGYDYYQFDAENAGTFDFALVGLSAKVRMCLYEQVGGTYKKVKGIKSKNASYIAMNNILLDGGIYYLEIMSEDGGAGRYNTDYSLEINTSYLPEATANNTWRRAVEITPDVQVEGYVGFGDASDFYKFEVDSLTSFDIDLTGSGKNAKLNVYEWNEAKGKLKKLKSAKLKYGEASLDNLSLDAGLYYVEVLSADKGKGKKNTEYELDITQNGVF